MPDTITIPVGGYYIEQNGARWHLSLCGDTMSIRLVETSRGIFGLSISAPASNLVELSPKS